MTAIDSKVSPLACSREPAAKGETPIRTLCRGYVAHASQDNKDANDTFAVQVIRKRPAAEGGNPRTCSRGPAAKGVTLDRVLCRRYSAHAFIDCMDANDNCGVLKGDGGRRRKPKNMQHRDNDNCGVLKGDGGRGRKPNNNKRCKRHEIK